MSNKCPRCGNSLMAILASNKNPLTDILQCDICRFAGERRIFNNTTLFDRITQSPEVLAEELVYCEKPECFCECASWRSVILGNVSYATKEKAIAATVAKLKEVEK